MDISTFFLITASIAAIALTIVAVYTLFLLVEARETLKHLNKVLSHADSIVSIADQAVARPVRFMSELFGVITGAGDILGHFSKGRKNE